MSMALYDRMDMSPSCLKQLYSVVGPILNIYIL